MAESPRIALGCDWSTKGLKANVCFSVLTNTDREDRPLQRGTPSPCLSAAPRRAFRAALIFLKASLTDLRKPVAATPPQEIMCLCVWLRRFLVLPGTTLPVRTAKVFNMGEERRRVRPGEPPLSLVILARCLAGNQPSGPLREEGGGDVSLLGMRPLYFSDIQQEQHSHHL
ncbi:unnamed protein product [Pleuronectes platessa]|uniref:Uncharacterized protein n=1 Tax=Pleuronectes platessa TaxID=8262 RepID=A0A9N7U3M7_PLEPL|nr:unnamed protein product [Pleuronectes platessa]